MMTNNTLICENEQRRHKVREKAFYGLDYLEVCDDRQTLCVYFLGKAPLWLKAKKGQEPKDRNGVTEIDLPTQHVRIEGGRRITDLKVVRVTLFRYKDPAVDDFLKIKLEYPGDFSPYTLSLVRLENDHPVPAPDMDPRYAEIRFNFNIEECSSDLDCYQPTVCPPPQYPAPEINYLAKDYASFRQLILDRLAVIMPDWQERHVPDIGIALVELLAYAGDQLSYYQDAVATEAYLDTARQRISVRRHARLVDYQMHEGCNARAWVFVKTDAPKLSLKPNEISFVTGHNNRLPADERVLTWDKLRHLLPTDQYEVFEPLVKDQKKKIDLYEAHNEIEIYTWGDKECCLPRGATTTVLVDGPPWQPPETEPNPEQTAAQQKPGKKEEPPPEYDRQLHLQKGDVLIFEEIKGPKTGNKADADPTHRHVVRLIEVNEIVDKLYEQPLLEVTWAEEDALPFPLCISAIGPAPKCELLKNITVARGNIILVDHGQRIDAKREDEEEAEKKRWCVPIQAETVACKGEGRPGDVVKVPGWFRPYLKKMPLTFSQPLAHNDPAGKMLTQDPRRAKPWIQLTSTPDCQSVKPNGKSPIQPHDNDEASLTWEPQRDLLNSNPDDLHFVAEVDNRGRAHLRFGDGELGRRPEAGTRFKAVYRVGNGLTGNVGAEAISHLILSNSQSGVDLVRNPLPARGGIDPEPLGEVKLFAPHAFRRRLERAITAADYAEIVMRDFKDKVQRAAAVLRWTGSWYEVLVAIDQRGRAQAEQRLLAEIRSHLFRYRRIGHDLAVRSAQTVPLDIEMEICVRPDYLRGHVKADLRATFSNRALPDGRRGFFHPDNLTFGEGVYLSKLVAAAQAIPGVESAVVKKLERLYEGPNGELADGLLRLGPLEVAQVDNDPSYPENGQFKLMMRGGR